MVELCGTCSYGAAMTSVTSAGTTVRVCIVADVRIYRDGLIAALADAPGLHLTCTATGTADALDTIRSSAPDVVLVDLGSGGIDLVRSFRRELVNVRVVAFGVDDSERTILACAEAGVAGYVCREASRDELLDIVRSAARDEVICSPKIAASLFRRLATLAAAPQTPQDALTLREQQVLALIGEGLPNKQIAAQLSIAEATVKNHVHNLLEKLHVKRRAQAAGLASPRAQRRTG